MAIDTRKHNAPAAGETPSRQAINNLSLSVRDPIPASGATEQTTILSALAALTPAIEPSTSNPIYFHRSDLNTTVRVTGTGATAGLAVTTDGLFKTVSPQVNISGAAAVDTPVNLAGAVTVPARPFGATPYAVRIHGSVACTISPNFGARIEALLDNTVVASYTFTNAGGTNATQTFTIDRTLHVDDESSHTALVRIIPLGGGLTVLADTARFFEVHTFRRMAL